MLEAIPSDVALTCDRRVTIPTIGIGAGPLDGRTVQPDSSYLDGTSVLLKQYARLNETVFAARMRRRDVQSSRYTLRRDCCDVPPHESRPSSSNRFHRLQTHLRLKGPAHERRGLARRAARRLVPTMCALHAGPQRLIVWLASSATPSWSASSSSLQFDREMTSRSTAHDGIRTRAVASSESMWCLPSPRRPGPEWQVMWRVAEHSAGAPPRSFAVSHGRHEAVAIAQPNAPTSSRRCPLAVNRHLGRI